MLFKKNMLWNSNDATTKSIEMLVDIPKSVRHRSTHRIKLVLFVNEPVVIWKALNRCILCSIPYDTERHWWQRPFQQCKICCSSWRALYLKYRKLKYVLSVCTMQYTWYTMFPYSRSIMAIFVDFRRRPNTLKAQTSFGYMHVLYVSIILLLQHHHHRNAVQLCYCFHRLCIVNPCH